MDISVVVPMYNEEENIPKLYRELVTALVKTKKEYELIFVDDGSTDNTLEVLEEFAKRDDNLKVLSFNRNYKKAAALTAGFKESKGKIIVTIDADLQEDPNELPKFLEQIEEGYDMIVGWRKKRVDAFPKRISSKIFNLLGNLLFGTKIHDNDCGFKVMKREVVENLKIYGGLYRYIPIFAKKADYKVTEVEISHEKRKHGKSRYGTKRLLGGFLDIITVKFLTGYFERPLHLFGSIGLLLLLAGGLISIYLSYIRIILNMSIGNRPMLLLGILLLILGVQSISIGLIGELIMRNSGEAEKTYHIKKRLN